MMKNEDVKLSVEANKLNKAEGSGSNERVLKWNLRDRKLMQLSKAKQQQALTEKAGVPKVPSLSLELNAREIAEDLFAFTGKLSLKRTNKRDKNVQKQIDLIYPGGGLETITVDRYKVPTNKRKKLRILWLSFFNSRSILQNEDDNLGGDVGRIKRSKILIKIPKINNTKPEVENNPIVIDNNNKHDGLTEETRAWNLRPRNPKCKLKNGLVDPEKTEKAQPQLKNINKSGEKEKEKKKLSVCISLSKEEIEEDMYALTGSKPSRKPKKRVKNVQKKVDSVFPGLWLVSISPDSYKVSENSMKVRCIEQKMNVPI
ncbi:hypothetical protein CASFOL_039869 [Castilleja foliolosa]|uniref:Uncharacterized protein n=1 Tax=Castilleja foliolosa TaxID=1961234 RepID=A0ABD3BGU7_9LAMI